MAAEPIGDGNRAVANQFGRRTSNILKQVFHNRINGITSLNELRNTLCALSFLLYLFRL